MTFQTAVRLSLALVALLVLGGGTFVVKEVRHAYRLGFRVDTAEVGQALVLLVVAIVLGLFASVQQWP